MPGAIAGAWDEKLQKMVVAIGFEPTTPTMSR